MQIDLFAPKESGSVVVSTSNSGYLAKYTHSPSTDLPPVVIVDGVLDTYVYSLLERSNNLAVSWWLMASYAYYLLDETIISDECFDQLTQVISDNYQNIVHVNKDLVTEDRLSCGSAYDLRVYPTRVMVCASRMISTLQQAHSQ